MDVSKLTGADPLEPGPGGGKLPKGVGACTWICGVGLVISILLTWLALPDLKPDVAKTYGGALYRLMSGSLTMNNLANWLKVWAMLMLGLAAIRYLRNTEQRTAEPEQD